MSIEHLAEARGVNLKAHGKDLIGLCPFHDDKEPSLVITPSKNLWHCLGACQTGGSVIDWVMKAESVSFRHAVELLRDDYVPTVGTPKHPGNARKARQIAQADASDQVLMQRVIGFYNETLKAAPKALEYMQSRGLSHPEVIDRFKLGFSDRTLCYRIPPNPQKKKDPLRLKLQRLGILRQNGHEHFHGSLVIPVIDEDGNTTEVYGRKVTRGLRKETAKHLYLPGPHRGVWNTEALKACEEIILCESLIDALTFWCAGYRNVTASYGTEGFTKDHLETFKRHGIKRVLIAYDRDVAGDKAAKVLAKKLMAESMTCYRVQFPKGMDANEYALKVKPAEKSLGVVVRKAEWMGKGKPPSDDRLNTEATKATKEEKTPSRSLVAEQLLATPEPPAPKADVAAEIEAQQVVFRFGDRRYRVRGLDKNTVYTQLKVNLLASKGDNFFVDTFDLYAARPRKNFVRQTAKELSVGEEVIKRDLGKVLLKLEELVDEQIRGAMEPKEKPIVISEKDKQAALEFLKNPKLLDRILNDFETCGVVGEQTNKLVGYLACVSRKLEEPLAVIIQSSSAAGKSLLMEAILSLMPPEDFSKYSAMTGQSLFYLGQTDLKHRILAIVEEEGAERASYALKLLQSEGELTIASTGKDPQTGRLVTQEYRVEGPVMILLTTTAIEIDDELLNRCIVLTVDEDREQTRAIHRMQRKAQTIEGLLARRDREYVQKLHQNAQRLLRPILVANPYAEQLTFLDEKTRTRRDHMKYLTLIRTIALLHQHQRPRKRLSHHGKELEYIEVEPSDITLANNLAHEVLGRSLDELPPQTRRLLEHIDDMVTTASECLQMTRSDYRFTRREVREYTGWGHTQLKVHLKRLEEMEYLLAHQGGRGLQFVYELLYDRNKVNGHRFLPRLIDLKETGEKYDTNWSGSDGDLSGQNPKMSGPSRPQVGPKSGGCRGGENGNSDSNSPNFRSSTDNLPKNAHLEPKIRPYVIKRTHTAQAKQ